MVIRPRHRDLLRQIWHSGPASRSELAARLGLRPNTIGDLVQDLIAAKLLREGESESRRVGRPKIPLDIDPESRRVLGIAWTPGKIQTLPLGLSGQPSELPHGLSEREIPIGGRLHPIDQTADLLAKAIDPSVLAIALTVTGFIDRRARQILFSSMLPEERSVGLEKLWRAAGSTPIVVGNDMHALAAHWLMQKERPNEDVLLVHFGDGSLGAIHLIQGRPSEGSITSASELGHMRFPIPTERCYCGSTGCLERICSTTFLAEADRREGVERSSRSLRERIRVFDTATRDPGLDRILVLLAMGVANAINFTRPHRLVLVGPIPSPNPWLTRLADRVRQAVLPALSDRLTIETADAPKGGGAEVAAWLALAGLFREGWAWD